jgi:hypothetical protein
MCIKRCGCKNGAKFENGSKKCRALMSYQINLEVFQIKTVERGSNRI